MALSITQKLTITVAVLSFLTLAPAAITLYLWMHRGVEAKGIDQADAAVLAAVRTILAQLDEDILVEFTGGRVDYDKLRIPFDHWLVMREGGKLEAARGIFEQDRFVALGAPTRLVRRSENGVLAVASTPLVSTECIPWDGIPTPAQGVVMTHATGGQFLSARGEVLGSRTIYDVKLLFPDHVVAVEVSDNGETRETEQKDLPDRLPAGMEVTGSSGQIVREPRIMGWQAYHGELIAVVEGRAENGEPVQVAVNRFGERYIVKPDGTVVQMLEESRLWVVVAYDMGPDLAGVRFFGTATAAGGALIWLLIITIAWQVTKRALRPVDEIVRQTAKIDAPHLNERLPVGVANDELSRVARTVNKMLDRIQDGYRREQQFTGDASHEMRTPLAKMIAEIDLALSQSREKEEYETTLTHLRRYAQGMQQLVESLLMLARLDSGSHDATTKPFDVVDVAFEILKTLPEESARRIRLELGKSADPMQALGHRYLIRVLLGNLIDNAVRYSPQESCVHLRVYRNAESIHIEVEDEGPGIPENDVALVFNRFHRLEQSRSRQTGGVGLGLSIVKAIAHIHNTAVKLTAGAQGGTLAAFTLPASNSNAQMRRG